MAQDKHTPGPWAVEPWGNGCSADGEANIVAPNSDVVIAMDVLVGEAEFIVQRVNAHEGLAAERDRLKASNTELADVLEKLADEHADLLSDTYGGFRDVAVLDNATTALSAARSNEDPDALAGCADNLRNALLIANFELAALVEDPENPNFEPVIQNGGLADAECLERGFRAIRKALSMPTGEKYAKAKDE
jgi:hypothetical protein